KEGDKKVNAFEAYLEEEEEVPSTDSEKKDAEGTGADSAKDEENTTDTDNQDLDLTAEEEKELEDALEASEEEGELEQIPEALTEQLNNSSPNVQLIWSAIIALSMPTTNGVDVQKALLNYLNNIPHNISDSATDTIIERMMSSNEKTTDIKAFIRNLEKHLREIAAKQKKSSDGKSSEEGNGTEETPEEATSKEKETPKVNPIVVPANEAEVNLDIETKPTTDDIKVK
ncbi:MAG: hypothetical protein AAF734_05880, partial [Bacteroidota bacterium]